MKSKKKLSIRMTMYCLIFAILLSLFIGGLSVLTYYNNSLEHYRKYISTVLKTSRDYLNGEDIKNMAESELKAEYYYNIQKNYNELIESSEIEYIYVITLSESGKYKYIFCGLTPEDIMNGEVDLFNTLIEDSIEYNVIEIYDRIITGEIDEEFIANRMDSEYILSGGIPLYDSLGGIVGIIGADINMKDINDNLLKFIRELIIGIFIIASVFLLIFISRVNKNIIKPILKIGKHTTEFVKRIKEKNMEDAYHVISISTGDEIELLAAEMNGMMKEMIDYMLNIESFSAMQERYDIQFKLAKQIQQSIIPDVFPAFPERTEFNIYAVMKLKKEVGREFYDFFMIDGTHLGIIIAEVSGEGVPAALFMMVTRTLLKNYSELGLEPAKVLVKANNELCENNDAEMTVSALLGVFDIYNGILIYANSGKHDILWAKKGNEFEVIKAREGFLLGTLQNIPFYQERIILDKEDMLLFYTNGVTGLVNKDNVLFDFNYYAEKGINGDRDVTNVLDYIILNVDEHMEEEGINEDITMLSVKYVGVV